MTQPRETVLIKLRLTQVQRSTQLFFSFKVHTSNSADIDMQQYFKTSEIAFSGSLPVLNTTRQYAISKMPCVTYLSKQISHALATISATKSRLESGSLSVSANDFVEAPCFQFAEGCWEESLKVSTLRCRYSSCKDRQLNTEHRFYRMTGMVGII